MRRTSSETSAKRGSRIPCRNFQGNTFAKSGKLEKQTGRKQRSRSSRFQPIAPKGVANTAAHGPKGRGDGSHATFRGIEAQQDHGVSPPERHGKIRSDREKPGERSLSPRPQASRARRESGGIKDPAKRSPSLSSASRARIARSRQPRGPRNNWNRLSRSRRFAPDGDQLSHSGRSEISSPLHGRWKSRARLSSRKRD